MITDFSPCFEVSVRKEFKRFRKALLVSPEIYGLMSIDSFFGP